MNAETIHRAVQLAAWAELAVCWLAWLLASVRTRGKGPRAVKASSAPGAWLGVLLNLLGMASIAVNIRPAGYLSPWLTLVPAMVIAPPSVLLAWAARRHLGSNWRFGAVLNEDHKLVKTGPYISMRHPIYASLLGMVLATGGAYTWWPFGVVGAVLTLLGIEIRVKSEEHLMEKFFQDEFIEYQARTRAFFPF